MKRLVFLLALVLAAPAHAAPTPLARVDTDSVVTLSGDRALFTRVRGRVLTVYSIPVTGGTPKREFSYTGVAGANRIKAVLSASAQRVAIAVLMERDQEWIRTQPFTGVLGAPWTPLGPRARIPPGPATLSVQVDGDRVFAVEVRDRFGNLGATAHDPAPHDVPFYGPLDAASAVFAGDLVAYATAAPEDEDAPMGDGQRVAIKNWRTGAEHAVMDFPEPITSIALKPDGTTLATGLGSVFVWAPGSAPRRLTSRGPTKARFAGAGVVLGDDHGPRLNGRHIGAPTESAGDLAADDRHVLWTANGCLLAADVTDTDTGPHGPGPCPRSEIAETSSSQPLARTLKVRLRCVYAPGRCRGTVRLMGTTRRFAIAAGRTGTVHLPLTAAAFRALRRRLAREPDDPRDTTIGVPYRARTDDGAEIPGYEPTLSIDRPG